MQRGIATIECRRSATYSRLHHRQLHRLTLPSVSSFTNPSRMRIINHTSYHLDIPSCGPRSRIRNIHCTVTSATSESQRLILKIPLGARWRDGWSEVEVVSPQRIRGEKQDEKQPLLHVEMPRFKAYYKNVRPPPFHILRVLIPQSRSQGKLLRRSSQYQQQILQTTSRNCRMRCRSGISSFRERIRVLRCMDVSLRLDR
jgi:hypothetical protein